MKIFEISYAEHHEPLYCPQGLNSSPWTPKNMKKTGRRKGGKKEKAKRGKKHRTHKQAKKRERESLPIQAIPSLSKTKM